MSYFDDVRYKGKDYQTKDLGQMLRTYFITDDGYLYENIKDENGYRRHPFTGWMQLVGSDSEPYLHIGFFEGHQWTPAYTDDQLPADVYEYVFRPPQIPFGELDKDGRKR